MSDWQVGDLAACVTVELPGFGRSTILEVGRVYRVSGTYISSFEGLLGLILEGVTPRKYPGFHHELFRKIRPDEHEACEPEFVTLLKRTKRTVRAISTVERSAA